MDANPKLLVLVRNKLRTNHYSYRTEQQYLAWIRRFILHHGKRHPRETSGAEVEQILIHLAVERKVSASTQNQALSAILFLYRQVLEIELPWLTNITRARKPARLAVVLSRQQAQILLNHVDGRFRLIVQLLYGCGLRLMEGLRLRVKDIDFEYSQIVVRDGKGNKDRVTVLPELLVEPLGAHLRMVRDEHENAVKCGCAGVELPFVLARKYPGAGMQWAWQYLFPATRASTDPRSGLFAATICAKPVCSVRFVEPPARQAFSSRLAHTPCGIVSQLICWNGVMTFAPCRRSARSACRRVH